MRRKAESIFGPLLQTASRKFSLHKVSLETSTIDDSGGWLDGKLCH